MSFFDEIQKSWEKGKKGTEEVPLEQGIEAVLKIAQKEEEKEKQTIQERNLEGKE